MQAETLRIATYDAGLTRRGPGLLLRDIQRGGDAQVDAVADVIAAAAPDILLLTGIDYDHGLEALRAFAAELDARGHGFAHLFAARPNSGRATGLDMDGDGRRGRPEDAQGYGWFAGERGLAVLSRHPIRAEAVRDFSGFLWEELPGALLPEWDGHPFPSAEARAAQRLSSTAHWEVPVDLGPDEVLYLLVFRATPPVFDGPENRNGLRNHDEAAFWLRLIEGALPMPPPAGPVVVLGNANLDTVDGDGLPGAMAALLAHPRLQDPRPRSIGGTAAADPGHAGDPGLDTAAWAPAPGPGNLRVDYVLPDAGLQVLDAGVFWPEEGSALAATVATASRHRLVWVDVVVR